MEQPSKMLDCRHLRVIWFLIVFLSLMKSVYSEEAANGTDPEAGAKFLYSVIGKMHGDSSASSSNVLDLILDRVETKLGASGPGPGPTGPSSLEQFKIVAPTPLTYHDESQNSHIVNNERYPPYPTAPSAPAGPSDGGPSAPGYGPAGAPAAPTAPAAHDQGSGPGHQDQWIPPLSKEELMALYQAAVHKGNAINLNSLPPLGVHQMTPTGPGDAYQNQNHNNVNNNYNNLPNYQQNDVGYNNNANLQGQQGQHLVRPTDVGTVPGYQYFFYPISSFGGNGNGNGGDQGGNDQNLMMMMFQKQGLKKKVEPLFLAMAGFVGMAMVFIVSVLFLPKISNLAHFRDKVSPFIGFKQAPQEFTKFSKLVIESIEGKDCTERLTCEVGRAFRSMHIGNKPIRLMEVMLPPSMAEPLAKLRRAYIRREKCHYIPCRKNSTIKKNDFSKFQQFKPKPKTKPLQIQEKNIKVKSNKH